MEAVKPAAPEVTEAWRKTEVARNAQRLHPMDILDALFTGHQELHGDRGYGDDAAMYCAMACFQDEPVMVICNRKGRTTKDRMKFRFGSPEPEGYRKALRCMKLAEKFRRPVVTMLDLAGAYPGLGAEERGQGEAIARNLIEMSMLRVPTIAVITGEGGKRWCACPGGRGPRVDAGECDLLRHLPGGLRKHHVEGFKQAPAGGRGVEVHRARCAAAGVRGWRDPRASRWHAGWTRPQRWR